jgi:putative membrane protein
MKKILLSSMIAASLTLAASQALSAEPVVMQNNLSSPQKNMSNPQAKEAHILGTIITVDKVEIKAGKLAAMKASDPNVKRFAETMVADHTRNLIAVKQLAKNLHITPTISSHTNLLKKQSKKDLSQIKSLSGRQFDLIYMAIMVKGHEAALNTIDQKLLPKAQNPMVKSFLSNTRNVVAGHLQQAQTILKQLAIQARRGNM